MSNQNQAPIHTFASLHWYDETIKFIFNFVAKTSELLLAAGVVISSANFLTDGGIMQDHTPLSVAWAWAQALAIDSSLGIVFVNGFQAAREHDKIKAVIYFTLTAMLATVAGLLTHFDALAHATGLPVTSQGISGIIPLWMLTGLRAVAVIGFLLVSRLKNVSFSKPQEEAQEPRQTPEPAPTPQLPPIDYNQLATALAEVMQQRAKVENISVVSEETAMFPLLQSATDKPETAQEEKHAQETHPRTTRERPQEEEGETEERIARAYAEIKAERERNGDSKPISARELASRARVRRSTCGAWLQAPGINQETERQEEAQDSYSAEEASYARD
jgi:hypothetical protein